MASCANIWAVMRLAWRGAGYVSAAVIAQRRYDCGALTLRGRTDVALLLSASNGGGWEQHMMSYIVDMLGFRVLDSVKSRT